MGSHMCGFPLLFMQNGSNTKFPEVFIVSVFPESLTFPLSKSGPLHPSRSSPVRSNDFS